MYLIRKRWRPRLAIQNVTFSLPMSTTLSDVTRAVSLRQKWTLKTTNVVIRWALWATQSVVEVERVRIRECKSRRTPFGIISTRRRTEIEKWLMYVNMMVVIKYSPSEENSNSNYIYVNMFFFLLIIIYSVFVTVVCFLRCSCQH